MFTNISSMTTSVCVVFAIVCVFSISTAYSQESGGEDVHPNIKIIQKFFEYYGQGDLDGIRSVMAPDVEWHIPGHHPLAGTKKGVEEIMAFFALLQKANFKAEVLFLGANENYVVDVHRGWGEYDGNTVDTNWVLVYQIQDGKITKVQNFSGDQHAADMFFWKVYPLKPVQDRIQQ